MEPIDALVEELRAAAGLGVPPEPEDAWRLAEWLGEGTPPLRIVVNGRACGLHLGPDGSGEITLADGLAPAEQTRALLEELGHWVLLNRWGSYALPSHLPLPQRERLLRRWDDREEDAARSFMLAWLLPRGELVRSLADGQDPREWSGCTEEEVRERLRRLRLHG